jgi:hypothetical protein
LARWYDRAKEKKERGEEADRNNPSLTLPFLNARLHDEMRTASRDALRASPLRGASPRVA